MVSDECTRAGAGEVMQLFALPGVEVLYFHLWCVAPGLELKVASAE